MRCPERGRRSCFRGILGERKKGSFDNGFQEFNART
nr:MAG TPA: hypothetical protein [Caudoviricetes sp.]